MDIHKPKPWHGWREFLKEYVIIVVGVLTALGAEQVVENLHWGQRLAETRGQLRDEVSNDVDAGVGWLALGPCVDRQLDALEAAVWTARSTGTFTPPATPYGPALFQFKSDAWLNARSLQVSDHLSAEETSGYSGVYFFSTEMRDNVVQLHQQAAALAPLRRSLDHVTPAEADEFLVRIGQTRELQSRMHEAAILMIRDADRLNVPVKLAELRRDLAVVRKPFAACMSDPAVVDGVVRRTADVETIFQKLNLSKRALPG
jgi:hypothetical protein